MNPVETQKAILDCMGDFAKGQAVSFEMALDQFAANYPDEPVGEFWAAWSECLENGWITGTVTNCYAFAKHMPDPTPIKGECEGEFIHSYGWGNNADIWVDSANGEPVTRVCMNFKCSGQDVDDLIELTGKRVRIRFTSRGPGLFDGATIDEIEEIKPEPKVFRGICCGIVRSTTLSREHNDAAECSIDVEVTELNDVPHSTNPKLTKMRCTEPMYRFVVEHLIGATVEIWFTNDSPGVIGAKVNRIERVAPKVRKCRGAVMYVDTDYIEVQPVNILGRMRLKCSREQCYFAFYFDRTGRWLFDIEHDGERLLSITRAT